LAAINPDVIKQHGTRSTYTQYGCRCEECTAANREYDRERRRRERRGDRVMNKTFTFQGGTVPVEVLKVAKHYLFPVTPFVLAEILNAYEQWRRSELTTEKGQPNDRIEDTRPGGV
jgi:hypothetical protein